LPPSGVVRTVIRVGVLVGLVAAQGLIMTGAASAESTSVQVVRGELVVRAAAGQANQVTVLDTGRSVVISDVLPMVPGAGCGRVTLTQVSCSSATVTSVLIDTADRDDLVRYDGSWFSGTYLGAGNDTYLGGSGSDTVHGGGDGDTLYGGGGGDWLYGDDGADHLFGGDEQFGGDFLYGGAGEDELVGGVGEDLLDGGLGNDKIDGTDTQMRDMAVYDDRTTAVKVDLSANTGGETALNEIDTILNVRELHGGSGNDTLTGNELNNTILGYGGENHINGGDGSDELSGGPDKDYFDGGTGSDICHAGLPSEGDELKNCNP
jgi:Ca2+-binding RTX toxin-like protein